MKKQGIQYELIMKHLYRGLRVLAITLLIISTSYSSSVFAVSNPGLQIAQAKVTTSSQFITLYNNSDSTTSGSYQLVYYNNYDRSKATSTKVYNVSGSVQGNGYYIFNDGQLDLCNQAKIDSVSLGFSTTSGSIELVKLDNGASATISALKWVSKSAPDGVQLLPAAAGGYDTFLQYDFSVGSWGSVQAPNGSPCAIQKIISANLQSENLPGGQAPSVSVVTESQASLSKNSGLKAPVVNEMLPNPKSPQSDSDDEFVELYNPNDKDFYLDGYKLGWGKTNISTYSFEDATVLPAKSYTVFNSSDTSLSLSNSGSQVLLLDPSGAVISQSAVYDSAKDGQAWALVNGEWKWLTKPTPGNANNGVMAGPEESSVTVAAINANSSGGSTNVPGGNDSSVKSTNEDALPLHPTVLAGIGLSAVGYGVYEYRRDIANRIFQIRRYFKLRRQTRAELPGRGNILISK